MRLLQGLLVITLFVIAGPAHAAWKSVQEYMDSIRNNPLPPPVITTYQDYLDAFPHGVDLQGHYWFDEPDVVLDTVRQIVLDVV